MSIGTSGRADDELRTQALTFLRFAGAFWVLLYHFGQETVLADWGLRPLGPPMMSFFFVLSGFVMSVNYRPGRWRGARDYWAARVARIAPIYYLALALSVAVFGMGVLQTPAFATSALFLQSWFPPYAATINIPAWSLSVEAFFYACFPVIFWVLQRRVATVRAIWMVVALTYVVSQVVLTHLYNLPGATDQGTIHSLVYYFPLAHLCSFLIGIATGVTLLRGSRRFVATGGRALWTIAFVGFLIAGLLMMTRPSLVDGTLGIPRLAEAASLWAPYFAVLVAITVHPRNQWAALLESRPARLLGDWSYGIYILQFPFALLLTSWVFDPLGLQSDAWYFFPVLLVLLTALAALLFHRYETPARSSINRALRSRRPAPEPDVDLRDGGLDELSGSPKA